MTNLFNWRLSYSQLVLFSWRLSFSVGDYLTQLRSILFSRWLFYVLSWWLLYSAGDCPSQCWLSYSGADDYPAQMTTVPLSWWLSFSMVTILLSWRLSSFSGDILNQNHPSINVKHLHTIWHMYSWRHSCAHMATVVEQIPNNLGLSGSQARL